MTTTHPSDLPDRTEVLVIGGGVVGVNAARMAMGMGADVVVMDNSPRKLVELDNLFGPRMKTMFSTIDSIDEGEKIGYKDPKAKAKVRTAMSAKDIRSRMWQPEYVKYVKK